MERQGTQVWAGAPVCVHGVSCLCKCGLCAHVHVSLLFAMGMIEFGVFCYPKQPLFSHSKDWP